MLILRDVLGFSGAEVAETLETTPESVYSLLQRAHRTVDEKLPAQSQQAALQALGDERLRELVDRYMRRGRAPTSTRSSRCSPRTSPHDAAAPDLVRRPRRGAGVHHPPPAAPPGPRALVPTPANGQVAFGQWIDGKPHGIHVITLHGDRVAEMAVFLEPELFSRFGL